MTNKTRHKSVSIPTSHFVQSLTHKSGPKKDIVAAFQPVGSRVTEVALCIPVL
jgi:hypothetical protein